jgi:REP element-mobilizing transposase RayT
VTHTYTLLHYHVVFSMKGRKCTLDAGSRQVLYPYMAGIVQQKGGAAEIINGTCDHVHLLLDYELTLTWQMSSKPLREVRRHGSTKKRELVPSTGKRVTAHLPSANLNEPKFTLTLRTRNFTTKPELFSRSTKDCWQSMV